MSSVLRYSLMRFMLLLGVGLVAYVLGARGAALILIAFVGSGLISLVLLRAPREDVARKVAERADPNRPRRGVFARINQRIEAANRAEDEALDEAELDAGTRPAGEGGDLPAAGSSEDDADHDPAADRDDAAADAEPRRDSSSS